MSDDASPKRRESTISSPPGPTCCRMWQFLYFLPLPHGHGSLRPTWSSRLRIGSVFFGASLAFVDHAVLARRPERAEPCRLSWLIGKADHGPGSSSSSSMRKTVSVILSSTPSHIASNSFMPSRLYSVLGSTWA